ncbi:VOC family protein [Mycobacterium sp. 1164985.4]|uniref:VOC family protein n=1 Tax=Mycobacterium sp. 1164985.4 TaxID=1834069 RepID=UPI0008023571|nr:VOC family protein [Mycobacterium sp. 1164985.4]OBK81703.1 extradiol dioxygenase [Mycobacterium sp. 1164985.4]
MTAPQPISVENFSHVCIGVSEMDAAVSFYTEVLGMDLVFDVNLDGDGMDAVTGGAAQSGRMVGGLIGGVMVELLYLGTVPAGQDGPHLGYTNISFRVADLDATSAALQLYHPDVRATPAVEIAGVRMLFVYDPDGTPIEFIELPAGATSTLEMWRPSS